MSKTETPFTQEYSMGINTSANVSPQPVDVGYNPKIANTDLEIDVKRYGTGKPKRVIMRAKLTND